MDSGEVLAELRDVAGREEHTPVLAPQNAWYIDGVWH
jgi:hypothetical protein